MNKLNIALFLLSSFIISSCGGNIDLYKDKLGSVPTDLGTLNKANADNILLTGGTKYSYNIKVTKPGHSAFFFSAKEKKIQADLLPLNNKESEYKIDKVEYSVYNNIPGGVKVSSNESLIKTNFINRTGGTYQIEELTPFMEDSTKIHFPNPLGNYNNDLKNYPPCTVQYPLIAGSKWKINNIPYQCIAKTKAKSYFGNIQLFIVQGSHEVDGIMYTTKYYFNEQKGFIKIKYSTNKGTKIELDLVDYSQKK
jgi:hypothetical protein